MGWLPWGTEPGTVGIRVETGTTRGKVTVGAAVEGSGRGTPGAEVGVGEDEIEWAGWVSED